MKQSLKHMLEICGGISLCFLISAIMLIISSSRASYYSGTFLQSIFGVSAMVFVVSILCLILLNIDWASVTKRLAE